MTDLWVEALIFLLLGLIVGSFIGGVTWRLPRGEGFIHGRSRCPACRHVLNAIDLLPVLGYLACRGRCRYCKARIAWRYPVIEICAGLVGLWALFASNGTPVWINATLGWCLLALAVLDFEDYWLPDFLTLPLIPAGLAVVAIYPRFEVVWHVAGAVIGYAGLWAIGSLYRRFRGREGLGGGDPKLLAAAGVWCALFGLAHVLLIGAATALVYVAVRHAVLRDVTGSTPIPFGPFLALGFWIVWLHQPLFSL